tara:strand:+ start:18207 stop:19901 length:1695 start_codon:yes stop_codon:yes gene_type:complete
MRIHWPFTTLLASVSLTVVLSAGCSSGSGSQQEAAARPDDDAVAKPVHIALAGGGWRAHTAHAAWTMSLLDDGAFTLSDVFGNVETLSSNSGGTWFLSMLVFSDSFRAMIEMPGALENYASPSGYLGLERQLFDDFQAVQVDANWCPFEQSQPVLYFYCRLASLAGDGALVWADIVKNVVFEPFGMNRALEESPTLLSGTRQSWATGKSLLIAATMLTDRVILTETDLLLDKLYYDAVLQGEGPAQVNVTPVTFASVRSGVAPPPVLSAGAFAVSYKDADFGDSAGAVFSNDALASGDVPVLLATAASSAAVGTLASYSVLVDNGYDDLTWELAYELSDLAVPVTMQAPIAAATSLPKSVHELAASNVARLADGGYQDNSAVAQLASFLQASGEADGFEIVAFDNVQALYTPPPGVATAGAAMGLDIALLFGEGEDRQVCAGTGEDKFCVTVPAQQVFAPAQPGVTTPATWSWTSPGAAGPTLSYTRFEVTTVDNPTFGLTAGSTGVLHVFTCVWPTADTAPWNGASDFDAYAAMLAAIRAGLQADGSAGLAYLREALSGSAVP